MFYSILLGGFGGNSYLCKDFPLNFSGKYLVEKKKVSTFATANEKQTPLTMRQAVLSGANEGRVL